MQPFHARYSMCLLKRVYLDVVFARNTLKLLMNVVQHLTVDFQRLKYSFVGVLKTEPAQVGCNLPPARISASTVRCSEE